MVSASLKKFGINLLSQISTLHHRLKPLLSNILPQISGIVDRKPEISFKTRPLNCGPFPADCFLFDLAFLLNYQDGYF